MSDTQMSRRQIVAAAAALPLVAVAGTAEAAPPPNMQDALRHLRAARGSLEKAKANKGGHRRKAIDLVEAAIREVQKGIDFAES